MILLATASEAGEAVEPTNPIIPDGSEIFWAATMFAALFLLIRFVLLPPLLKVMDEREKKISEDTEAANKALNDSSQLSSNFEDQLADVKAEAAAIVEQARTEAAAERAQLVSKAESEVAALKQAAQSEVAGERAKALAAVKPEVAKLSVEAASRVLERNVDIENAKPLVNKILTDFK